MLILISSIITTICFFIILLLIAKRYFIDAAARFEEFFIFMAALSLFINYLVVSGMGIFGYSVEFAMLSHILQMFVYYYIYNFVVRSTHYRSLEKYKVYKTVASVLLMLFIAAGASMGTNQTTRLLVGKVASLSPILQANIVGNYVAEFIFSTYCAAVAAVIFIKALKQRGLFWGIGAICSGTGFLAYLFAILNALIFKSTNAFMIETFLFFDGISTIAFAGVFIIFMANEAKKKKKVSKEYNKILKGISNE